MGVDILMVGDTGRINKISIPVSSNRTMYRNRHHYLGFALLERSEERRVERN